MRSLVLACVLLVTPAVAHACSCMEPGTLEHRMERAGVVVHGVVVGERIPISSRLPLHRLPRPPRWTPRFVRRMLVPSVTAEVDVIQAWKASPYATVSVNLGSGACCDCTLGAGTFAPGDEVILFGRVRDGVVRVGASMCNPPIEGSRVQGALDTFGPGITDLPASPVRWIRWGGRLGALLVLAAIGRQWLLFGRRRQAGPGVSASK